MRTGIGASYQDTENGMTMPDMQACLRAAKNLGEVIIFRSTGPWSKRWLESEPPYPSKNFHVKGKSSDWGPQAGFVPYNGLYSKVGHDQTAAKKGTAANQKGIDDGFAGREILALSQSELKRQRDLKCEEPPRSAIQAILTVDGRKEVILECIRPGDGMQFYFLAVPVPNATDKFAIYTFEGLAAAPVLIRDKLTTGKLRLQDLTPLYVMVSEEAGANRRPMTGDYDLMAICPTYANYMTRTLKPIHKDAIQLNSGITPKHAPTAQTFGAGSFLDKALDMRLHTGAKTEVDFKKHYDEHGDMGNLTPRILRAVNMLNLEMGAVGGSGALRRVHHNAESHRNAAFGALTAKDMDGKNDGFPLTGFHPPGGTGTIAKYGDVVTIDNMGEFRTYASDLYSAGYFVPKNWTWGMSIRDSANKQFGHILNR